MWIRRTLIIAAPLFLGMRMSAADAISSNQADEILAELRKIRAILESNGPNRDGSAQPTRVAIEVNDAPYLGSDRAPVVIVEFMDYQCPYCKQFQAQTFRDVKREYIDTGKVRFYVMDFPLDIHAQALLAAQAGRCAAEQGKFWPMHDRLQSENEALNGDKIAALAELSGLDLRNFQNCLQTEKYKDAIQRGISEAANKGIRATPTFVIAKGTETGIEGDVVVGAVPFGVFQKKIEALLQ